MPKTLMEQYTWEEIVIKCANKIEKTSKSFKRKEFIYWMMKKEEMGFCFDYSLYYRCFLIKTKYLDHDFDYLIALCGGEGIGKSTLAIQLGSVVSEGEFKSTHVCIDAEQFLNALDNSKEYDVIVADEGAFFLFSKDATTRSSKIVTKILTIIRQKRLCVIVNSVNFFLLDNYLRNHRTRLLIQIRKRGKYRQIVKKGIIEICNKAWRNKNPLSTRMRRNYFHDGYWNKSIPLTFDYDNYLTNKKTHMDESITEAQRLITPRDKNVLNKRKVKLSVIKKSLGMKPGNHKWFSKQHPELKAEMVGNAYVVDEEIAKDFVNKINNNLI